MTRKRVKAKKKKHQNKRQELKGLVHTDSANASKQAFELPQHRYKRKLKRQRKKWKSFRFLEMIFENSSPKGIFGPNMSDSSNWLLTANSRSLQAAALNYFNCFPKVNDAGTIFNSRTAINIMISMTKDGRYKLTFHWEL